MSSNGSETPQTAPPFRCQITVTFPWDVADNVDIAVENGGPADLFAAAAFLERTAHRILAAAEREAASRQIDIVSALPGGLS